MRVFTLPSGSWAIVGLVLLLSGNVSHTPTRLYGGFAIAFNGIMYPAEEDWFVLLILIQYARQCLI